MDKSNNVLRAENQQERLIKIGWIVGFIDGEGCFSIHFVKQPERIEAKRIRRGYKTGYQVAHEFAVVQGERSLKSLKKLQSYFGVGGVYINHRHDNHKEDLYRYSVARRQDLLQVIIPFFEQNQLQTAKKQDFKIFAQCVRAMERGEHLTSAGAIKIAKLTTKMNHRKPRTDLIRILRDQTPGLDKNRVKKESRLHGDMQSLINLK